MARKWAIVKSWALLEQMLNLRPMVVTTRMLEVKSARIVPVVLPSLAYSKRKNAQQLQTMRVSSRNRQSQATLKATKCTKAWLNTSQIRLWRIGVSWCIWYSKEAWLQTCLNIVNHTSKSRMESFLRRSGTWSLSLSRNVLPKSATQLNCWTTSLRLQSSIVIRSSCNCTLTN